MPRALPFLAALLVLAASTLTTAQSAAVPAALAGRYAYPHPIEHGRAIVQAALEPRIAALPFYARDMARSRLETRMRIPRRITVELPAERVRVTYEGEHTTTVETALGGTTTVTNPEGQEVQATHRLAGGWLEETFAGPNGELRQLLSVEPDGATLHLDVTLTSPRLGEPVRYRLDYRREP